MIRQWLVFFGPAPPGWWSYVLSRPFQHVCAAGCDAETRTWVFFDPGREGTQIDILPWGDSVDLKLGRIALTCAPHVLRFTPVGERTLQPALFSCVGAIKALLGVRSGALSPHGLYRHLLARGAEIVPVPGSDYIVEPVRQPGSAPA